MSVGSGEGRVVLTRGRVGESSHRLHGAVVSVDEGLVHALGDPERVVYMRSAAKPFQALAVVEEGAADAAGLTAEELAVLTGSHGGEPGHVELVEGVLGRLGLAEDALACGSHPPMHEPSARALLRGGAVPGRVHNNCSGKHAGMLALALHMGWELEGYQEEDHPVQRRIAREIAHWSGRPESGLIRGVDGCGVVCFALPLSEMAFAMDRLMRAATEGRPGPARVVNAMREHPWFVAGTDRLCTELIRVTGGRVVAKLGAEGVYCAGVPARGLGLAVKVEDGARRAVEIALVAMLERLDVLSSAELQALDRWRSGVVRNTRGEPAARLVAELPEGWGRGRSETDPASGSESSRPLDELLVALGAALALGDEGRVRRALVRALGAGVEREIEEALLQAHLFVGFPRALNALGEWRRLSRDDRPDPTRAEAGSGTEPHVNDFLERGARLCRTVYGSAYAELRRNVRALSPAIDRWMVEDGYGKVLSRSGLGIRERELMVIAILAVQGVEQQLYSHLRGALRVGCDPERVEAALEGALSGLEPTHREAMSRVWNDVRTRFGPVVEPADADP